MRPRRAAAPAKPPATVPVRASFGAGVCLAGVEGAGLGELWHLIVPLLLIGAGTMALAASLFRNKLD